MNNKTLCLDFGNTRQKAAVFQKDELLEEFIIEDSKFVEKILDTHKPSRSILSSVINHDDSIEEILKASTTFHKVSANTKLNFNIPINKPETIGADRIALIAAAVHFFPGKNNLIVSLGTCITYNFVNQFNVFLGGSISPGLI